ELIPMISQRKGVERGEEVTFGNFTWKDEFDTNQLGMEWLTLRTPATDLYSFEKRPGQLALECSPVKAAEMKTPAYIGRRMQHHQFTCETRMQFHPENEKQKAGMLLFKDEAHHYFFALQKTAGGYSVSLIQTSDSGEKTLAETPVKKGKFLDMKVVSTGLQYAFYYATQEGKWELLTDQVDASYLSTATAGGFTGSLIGMYATSE
ncbi:glycoside hydrolase family 43 protein, partial [Parabacteroides sp. OttesenSCG-928-J18]|nr:glycoside hydrolase family 43 protein [Parabacteroides sp. OttesenSCG-928-J18]